MQQAAPDTSAGSAESLLADGKDNAWAPEQGDRQSPGKNQIRKQPAAQAFDPSEPVILSRPSVAPRPADTSDSGKPENPVVLNFDDAELYEVVRTIADILGLNYMVDAAIPGKVTIHTAGNISKEQLFPIFNQILSTNNLILVQENGLYHVRPAKDMSRMPLTQALGRKLPRLATDQNQIIQIIPLRHISATEMAKIAQPFVSVNSSVVTHEDSNALIVVDNLAGVEKVMRLVDVFDIDIFSRVQHRIYPLRHTSAEESAKVLDGIFKAYGRSGYIDFTAMAIESMNALLVISSDSAIFDRVQSLIEDMDIATEATQPRIFVYAVKNGEAENLSQLMNSVFGGEEQKDEKTEIQESPQSAPKAPAPVDIFANVKAPKPKKPQIESGAEPGGTGTLKGEIRITPDEIRNALIIKAMPSDYKVIEEILKKVDVLPRQVLIEVTIAEITLDDKTELGVEWSFDHNGILDSDGNLMGTGLYTASVSDSGLSYTLGFADKWKNALSALATENKVNMLASPSVLASDNKEASINISREIPTASSTLRLDSDTTASETTIQYRNTGIILGVTPHINERGLVSMDISQEVSDTGDGVPIGGTTYPSFKKTSVVTSLTVNNAQTIAIGGLISDSVEDGDSGVPFLSKIPILGYLFGKKTKSKSKRELIVLITPRVINTSDDIDIVTQDFRSKLKALPR